MLEPLPNIGYPIFNALAHLQHRIDLQYFDGPLLSLFKDTSLDLYYLFHWVDKDDTKNRWLVFQIASSDLCLLMYKSSTTLHDMYIKHHFVYLVDFDGNGKYHMAHLVKPSMLPVSYIPSKDSYLDTSLTPGYLKRS